MTKLQLAREALKRYKADLRAGHLDAAEYWRGQASAYFTANPIDPDSVPALVRRGVFEMKTYGHVSGYYFASLAEREAIDKWLVRINHPLAYQAGTPEQRYLTIVREVGWATMNPTGGKRYSCTVCGKNHQLDSKMGIEHWAEHERLRLQPSTRTKLTEDEARKLLLRHIKGNPIGLYQSFHGNPPARTRLVQFAVPKRLVKIGRLKELVYAPEKPSRLTGNHFNHRFGDHGYKFVKGQEPVLAVSEDGKQLVIVEGSYKFGARGIIG